MSEQPQLPPADPNQVNPYDLGATEPWADATAIEQSVYETAYRAALGMWNGRQREEYITQIESENAQLAEELHTDQLTQILNKQGLLERSNEAIAASPDSDFVMVFIDLDNFKAVNDLSGGGHAEGDRVLKGFAKDLYKNIRHDDGNTDIAAHGNRFDRAEGARLSGDEFAIFMKLSDRNAASAQQTATQKADAIKARLYADLAPFFEAPELQNIGGSGLSLGLSIGCVVRQPGETAEDMLAKSDQRMADEKKLRHEQNGSYR